MREPTYSSIPLFPPLFWTQKTQKQSISIFSINQIITSKNKIKIKFQTTNKDARNAHAIPEDVVTLVWQPTPPSLVVTLDKIRKK